MKLLIDRDKCVGCGSCAAVCPSRIFRMSDGEPQTRHEEYCMACWHCVAVCPTEAISAQDVDFGFVPPRDEEERLVMSRRSIRRFRPELPKRGLVERALELSAWAPSGKNHHLHEWSVLWGRETVQKARELVLDRCRETGADPELLRNAERGVDLITCGAPCIIIGHNSNKALNPMLDTAIAAATAELMLVKSGLGTCWGGYMRRAINAWPPLKELAGIAPDREAYALVMVGVPDESYPRIPHRPAPAINWIEK